MMAKDISAFNPEVEFRQDSDKSSKITRRHFLDAFAFTSPMSQISQEEVIKVCDARISTHRNFCDWRFTEETLKQLLEKIPVNTQPQKILDFGCGDAPIIDVLDANPHLLKRAKIFGVDISEMAIRRAVRKAGNNKRFTFKCFRNLKSLPAYEGLDAGIANFVMHFKVSDRYIEWIYNSLKTGGYFIFNYYKAKSCPKHYTAVKKHFENVGFRCTDEFTIELQHHDGHVKHQTAAVMQKV